MKLLTLCRGNVARSQIAEAFLRQLSNNTLDVTSAGTKLSGPEQPLSELIGVDHVIAVMQEDGIDLSHNTRTQVTEEMAHKADQIILVVDDRDPVPDYILNHPNLLRWDVLDPKGQSLEFTREVRDRIKEFSKEYIASI